VAEQSVLQLSCDDRPPVEEMSGLRARFHLETENGRMWTLDGPNSIYSWRRPPEKPQERVER
jgi:hypothetical protein